jgi:hypothetical protein
MTGKLPTTSSVGHATYRAGSQKRRCDHDVDAFGVEHDSPAEPVPVEEVLLDLSTGASDRVQYASVMRRLSLSEDPFCCKAMATWSKNDATVGQTSLPPGEPTGTRTDETLTDPGSPMATGATPPSAPSGPCHGPHCIATPCSSPSPAHRSATPPRLHLTNRPRPARRRGTPGLAGQICPPTLDAGAGVSTRRRFSSAFRAGPGPLAQLAEHRTFNPLWFWVRAPGGPLLLPGTSRGDGRYGGDGSWHRPPRTSPSPPRAATSRRLGPWR